MHIDKRFVFILLIETKLDVAKHCNIKTLPANFTPDNLQFIFLEIKIVGQAYQGQLLLSQLSDVGLYITVIGVYIGKPSHRTVNVQVPFIPFRAFHSLQFPSIRD